MAESGSAPPGDKATGNDQLGRRQSDPSADISTDKPWRRQRKLPVCQTTQRDNPASPRWKWLKPFRASVATCFCASLARAVWVLSTLPTIKSQIAKVALKIISERQQDPELRARVIQEAQMPARVSAPNVIHVYQVGEVEGQLFIAMEFVNGTTLSKWQSDPAHKWQDILRMYIAAGQGLQSAHEAGLVHRDFKPDNVLIGSDGRPRVADFGLARIAAKSGGGVHAERQVCLHSGARQSQLSANPLTQLGSVMGTPLYMSPEQHMGSQPTAEAISLVSVLRSMKRSTNSIRSRVIRSKHSPSMWYPERYCCVPMAATFRWPFMKRVVRGLSHLPISDSHPSMNCFLH